MSGRYLHGILGSAAPDPGCEAAFEALDRYVEAVLRGDDVVTEYAHVITHAQNCSACREDTEGLLTSVDEIDSSAGR